jgi:hypothetical protein
MRSAWYDREIVRSLGEGIQIRRVDLDSLLPREADDSLSACCTVAQPSWRRSSTCSYRLPISKAAPWFSRARPVSAKRPCLAHAAQRADSMPLLRVVGVESEAELAFAVDPEGTVIDFWAARTGGRSGLTGSRCGCPVLAAACRSTTTPVASQESGRNQDRQPAVAVVGHVIGRDQAKQLGWSDDRINSRTNTQPQHVRCSASSGGKYVPPVLSPSANGWARRRYRAGHRSWPRSLARPRYLADHFSLGSPVRGMSSRRHP